jgi:glycosyltransferase involved in cell wall biosynthesis
VRAIRLGPVRIRERINTLAALPGLAHTAHQRHPRLDADAVPLVSVVIATYNWSNVLRCAIASALRQTYPKIEVIVVGDGCSDDSAEVVASFADERVRWHNLAENSGSQSAPNNAGIELAHGDYIAYHGHDDVWLPSHLAIVTAPLRNQNAELAYSVTEILGPLGGGYRALRGVSRSGRYSPALWIPPSSVVHHKSLIQTIGPWRDYRTIDRPPDIDFVARAHEHGNRLVPVHALTVFKFNSAYRRNSYIEKPSHEQEHYIDRIERERAFIYRELGRVAFATVRSLFVSIGKDLPQVPDPPDPLPPGWYVTQLRRIRGLEPD